MLRSLDNVYRMDLGFDAERVLYGDVVLPSPQYSDPEERIRFVTQLERDLNVSPGVGAASVVTTRPTAMVEVAGRPAPEELPAGVFVLGVGTRYFESLGARVLRGRALTEDDGRAGSEAAVVNERFAALFFGGEEPLGRRIRVRGPEESMGPWLTIVGIGSNVRVGDVRRRDWEPDRGRPARVRAAVAGRGARARPGPAGAPRAVAGVPARRPVLVVREPADSRSPHRPADAGARAAAVRRAARRGVRGTGAPGSLARSVRCAPFRVTRSLLRFAAAHTVQPAPARAGSHP